MQGQSRRSVLAASLVGMATLSAVPARAQMLESMQRPPDFPANFWNKIILLQQADPRIHTPELRDAIAQYVYGGVPVGWNDQKVLARAVAREDIQRRTDRCADDRCGPNPPSPIPLPLPTRPTPPGW